MRTSLILVIFLAAFTLLQSVAESVEHEKTTKKKRKILERSISIVAEPSEKDNGPTTSINNSVEVNPVISLDVPGARDANNPAPVESIKHEDQLDIEPSEKPEIAPEEEEDKETGDDKAELVPGLDDSGESIDDEESQDDDQDELVEFDPSFVAKEEKQELGENPELLPGLIEKDEDKERLVADYSILKPGLNEAPEVHVQGITLEPDPMTDHTSYVNQHPIYVTPAKTTTTTTTLLPAFQADLGQLLMQYQIVLDNNLLQWQTMFQQQQQQQNWFQMIMLQLIQQGAKVSPHVTLPSMVDYRNFALNPLLAPANSLYQTIPIPYEQVKVQNLNHGSVQSNSNRQFKEIVENYPNFGANLYRSSHWSPFAPANHWAESMSDPSGFNSKLLDGTISHTLPPFALPYPSATKASSMEHVGTISTHPHSSA